MKYTQCRPGRVFVVRFDHGEDFLKELTELIKKEDIRAGVIHFLGALEKAGIVVGPERVEVPPTPMWREFQDGRELVGFGTIFWKGEQPKVHIHSSIGRDEKIFLGCIRRDTTIYLTIEAIILELEGIVARRQLDEKTGVDLLEMES
ncbi:MAG TPA: PPC domain-containing DNA-binding protein [Candidatus Hypogeohydataceae bacterium YC41]